MAYSVPEIAKMYSKLKLLMRITKSGSSCSWKIEKSDGISRGQKSENFRSLAIKIVPFALPGFLVSWKFVGTEINEDYL